PWTFTFIHTGTVVGSNSVGTSGVLMHTINGGATWTDQIRQVTEIELMGVFFTDANTGTAVGGDARSISSRGTPVILRTTDGGTTWTRQESGTNENIEGVFFLDADTGIAVTKGAAYGGSVLRTTDGGATWTHPDGGTILYGLRAVAFKDAHTGLAVGDY